MFLPSSKNWHTLRFFFKQIQQNGVEFSDTLLVGRKWGEFFTSRNLARFCGQLLSRPANTWCESFFETLSQFGNQTNGGDSRELSYGSEALVCVQLEGC